METSPATLLAAADLAVSQFSILDAIILCAAADADCRVLLSEDMQDGFVWKGNVRREPLRKVQAPVA
jgi:predicted nucleic acid-binding protein